jgi:hypothetical protein
MRQDEYQIIYKDRLVGVQHGAGMAGDGDQSIT